jgi:ribosomal protein L37AE/L43A
VVHEAAHAAAVRLHGRGIRPHGAEWRALVSQSAARSRRPGRMALRGTEQLARAAAPRRKAGTGHLRYEHWCPVCQFSRWARRPVAAWRCAACVSAGLEGRLRIRGTTSQARGTAK